MSDKIPRAFIDELLSRVDIVELIGQHVTLKKSGRQYTARCPFHDEKTPSFSVSREKQFYYCFGCHAKGDAIGFLMAYQHLSFVEAVKQLADGLGLALPATPHDARQHAHFDAIYRVLQQAAEFYAEQLRHPSHHDTAVSYLKTRGVTGTIARDFQLGYAPDRWDSLLKRFDRQTLLEAGLVIEKDNGSTYDRFRHRIMFPIRDKRGRVVGFGGRVLDQSAPKYLNSPETAVFHKSQTLYGLYETLQQHSKPARLVLVEGYLDVIALHQAGLPYAVAALGTAVSIEQVEQLFRTASEIVLCFDGDKAGQKATWKTLITALPALHAGRQLRVMHLPAGTDPDTHLREQGTEAFVEKLQTAPTLSIYFFEHLKERFDLNTVEGRATLSAQAKPLLQSLPAGDYRELMLAQLREITRGPVATATPRRVVPLHRARDRAKAQPPRLSAMRTAIALLLRQPSLARTLEETIVDWSYLLALPGAALLRKIAEEIAATPDIDTDALLARFNDPGEHKTLVALAKWPCLLPENGIVAEFIGALTRLNEQARHRRLEELLTKQKAQGLDHAELYLLNALLTDTQR